MFPLGPPGGSNSPYQVLSAFAGNPLFLSLETLREEGLLGKSDLANFPQSNGAKVDFNTAWRYKKARLWKAFATFEFHRKNQHAAFDAFCHHHRAWLFDYALFCALKGKNRGVSWTEWAPEHRKRKPSALKQAAIELRLPIRYHQFLQFKFFHQWRALKDTCHTLGVRLIGDIPIFVAEDSADVWANPELFWLDAQSKATAVAGCPPDYFSRTGQRWGNPLYRWDKLKRSHYDWWVRRFKTLFELVDAARLDHFIGFHNYWRIPASHKTAEHGKWVKAPGEDFFKTVFKKLGKLPLIAEDLGVVTPAVTALRDKFSLPGMRVLQFAFGGDSSNPFLPHNFSKNTVVFTGTHDNDTTVGWFRQLKEDERQRVLSYLKSNGKEIHWDMIALALSSVANLAILPMQDILGLDGRARMNVPGTPSGNWTWRMQAHNLSPKIVEQLSSLTKKYDRSQKKNEL